MAIGGKDERVVWFELKRRERSRVSVSFGAEKTTKGGKREDRKARVSLKGREESEGGRRRTNSVEGRQGEERRRSRVESAGWESS